VQRATLDLFHLRPSSTALRMSYYFNLCYFRNIDEELNP